MAKAVVEVILDDLNLCRAASARPSLSHGERSECEAFRVRGCCFTDRAHPLTPTLPMGEGAMRRGMRRLSKTWYKRLNRR